ncbi:MAG: metallophosphoesterase [Isosphaeraceae bacterium]
MMRRPRCGLACLLVAIGLATNPVFRADEPKTSSVAKGTFLAAPYLQWGEEANPGDNQLELLWHTNDVEAAWKVSFREAPGDDDWSHAPEPTFQRVAVPSIEPHRVYRAKITGLPIGSRFDYRVLKDDKVVFESGSKARPRSGDPHRVVIFGDCSSGSSGQRRIAAQIAGSHPDLVVVTGDIVYSRGRISEYRKRFFPVYNVDEVSPEIGAPLLRSTLFIAAPGNHDFSARDLGENPDGMAYFLYWSQPLNGPLTRVGADNTPKLKGPKSNQEAFLDAAGRSYPRMNNFSFDVGGTHWLILDANGYTDWDDPAIRDWIANDLARASQARWRFVAFHQPGFQSSKAHFGEQKTRLLAPVFEQGHVDLVFAGHVHNYQRTRPLRFVPDRDEQGQPVGKGNQIDGRLTLDRTYDGVQHTRADGVIYLVTGGGGAKLYNPEQQDNPSTWEEFTCKFIADKHTITVMDVEPSCLTLRQIDEDGQERDRFVMTKQP